MARPRRHRHYEYGIWWLPVVVIQKGSHYRRFIGIIICKKCGYSRVAFKENFKIVKYKDICLECARKQGVRIGQRLGIHERFGIMWIPIKQDRTFGYYKYYGVIHCPDCDEHRLISKQSPNIKKGFEQVCRPCSIKRRMLPNQAEGRYKWKTNRPAWNPLNLIDNRTFEKNMSFLEERMRATGIFHSISNKKTPLESVKLGDEEYFISKYRGELKYLE